MRQILCHAVDELDDLTTCRRSGTVSRCRSPATKSANWREYQVGVRALIGEEDLLADNEH
jgi:hypothetical protein